MLNTYHIRGGNALRGTMRLHGAKNAVLPILAASVLSGKESIFLDCPALSDVRESLEILRFLGCFVRDEGNVVTVNSEALTTDGIPERLMMKMRSSVIFLGALIARCRSGRVSLPGGCEIGCRPIDLHLKAFREMGIRITESGGIIDCDAGNLHSANIHLDFPSVGATENVMLAATGASGQTVISNAAKEPEIVDLQRYLNAAGYHVSGAGTDKIFISGGKGENAEHRIMPDRIEAATYLCAVLLTGGELTLTNVCPQHMDAFFAALKEGGADLTVTGNTVSVRAGKRFGAVKRVRTYPYPGFPTDMQSVLMSLLSTASGTSVVTETIFPDRFRHVDGLTRMGADIVTDGNVAIIHGVRHLTGAHVTATDLRGGAALTIAALAAEGDSRIDRICYIERGYEAFPENLSALGADIRRK